MSDERLTFDPAHPPDASELIADLAVRNAADRNRVPWEYVKLAEGRIAELETDHAQALAERDHAREIACRLEQELARVQASHARGKSKKEHGVSDSY